MLFQNSLLVKKNAFRKRVINMKKKLILRKSKFSTCKINSFIFFYHFKFDYEFYENKFLREN